MSKFEVVFHTIHCIAVLVSLVLCLLRFLMLLLMLLLLLRLLLLQAIVVLFEAPIDVVTALHGFVLLHQISNVFERIIELGQVFLEHGGLLVLLEERVALAQHIVRLENAHKQLRHIAVVGHHASAHLVRHLVLEVRRLFGERHLDRRRSPRDEIHHFLLADTLQRFVNVGRIDIAADNVENRNVDTLLGAARHHDVFGLQQASHHIEHTRLLNLRLVALDDERRERGHEEVGAGRRHQRRDQANEVVVHVSGVAQGGGRRRHHIANDSVCLAERNGVVELEALVGNAMQRGVVNHHCRVGVENETLQRQNRVVRMHHHVRLVSVVGEHAVRLHNLLRVAVAQLLQQVRAETAASAASNAVREHETLQTVAVVRLAINHVHNLLVLGDRRAVALRPVVAGAAARRIHVHVFWIP
mmetsp:Transcript_56311/g.93791  ORF Transcript_56311/g.93791 Transcript_56311/m.93791 type:complete len:414 (-) Transcript_56311:118-1359(-)